MDNCHFQHTGRSTAGEGHERRWAGEKLPANAAGINFRKKRWSEKGPMKVRRAMDKQGLKTASNARMPDLLMSKFLIDAPEYPNGSQRVNKKMAECQNWRLCMLKKTLKSSTASMVNPQASA